MVALLIGGMAWLLAWPIIRQDPDAKPWIDRSLLSLERAVRPTLAGSDWIECEIGGSDLHGADLRGCRFDFAHLDGCNLARADLRGSDMRHAVIAGARLEGANMDGCCVSHAEAYGADMRNAELRGSDMNRSDMRAVDLQGANVAGVVWYGARYDSATRWPRGFDPTAAGAVSDATSSVAGRAPGAARRAQPASGIPPSRPRRRRPSSGGSRRDGEGG